MASKSDEIKEERPSPDQFDLFVPWACKIYQIDEKIIIVKSIQMEYISSDQPSNRHPSRVKGKSTAKSLITASSKSYSDNGSESSMTFNNITINCIYDQHLNLIELKFENNKFLPQKLFKIISLILPFYPHLSCITIKYGLSNTILNELNKMVLSINLTDICLDGASLVDANYHVLLERPSNLRQLSLCRCKINDEMVHKIADMLIHPLHASKTLSLLKLTSNYITDIGAVHLSNALRSNRQLLYLNLADNKISDDGAIAILNSLMYFIMTYEEVIESKTRYIEYLKARRLMEIDLEAKINKMNVTNEKRKKSRMMPGRKSKDTMKSVTHVDVTNNIPDFDDPFSYENIFSMNEVLYSSGNNKIAYLSLAYNDITIFTVRKILEVIKYQNNNEKFGGIVNINIEGNFLPVVCLELLQINDLLGAKVIKSSLACRKSLASKK